MTGRRDSVILPFFLPFQGCPSRCLFCDQGRVTGGGESIPTPDEIVRRVERYRSTAGGRGVEIAFYGASFTLLPPSVRDGLLMVAARLKRRGEVTAIRLSTRPDGIDPQTVSLLRRCDVDLVEIGVQSFDPAVLSASRRGHSPEDAERAVVLLKEGGVGVGIHLMTGLPGDTPSLSRASMERAIGLKPDLVRIHPVVVLEGSELACMMRRGEFQPWDDRTTVHTLKVMYHLALVRGVTVARIGLQADRFQNDGSVVGGFWHPSTGEIVRSALWGDFLERVVGKRRSSLLAIRTHPSSVSAAVGYGGENRRAIQRRTMARSIRFLSDPSLDRRAVAIEGEGWSVGGNLVRDLVYEQ